MEIKLLIQKKKVFDDKGWNRYYAMDKIIVNPGIDIFKESQLAFYIYSKFGVGRYMVLAFKKRRGGFWKYWLGDITENGFIRDVGKNKEIERLGKDFKKDLTEAGSYEERELIEESYDSSVLLEKEIKKQQRSYPQCEGLIKSRPGQLNPYEQ